MGRSIIPHDSQGLHPRSIIGDYFGAAGFDLDVWKAGLPARYSVYRFGVDNATASGGELSLLTVPDAESALDLAAPITPARRVLYGRILMRISADINHNVNTLFLSDNGNDYNIGALAIFDPNTPTWANPFTGSSAGGPALSDDQKLITTVRSVVFKLEAPIGASCIATLWCNGKFVRQDTHSPNGDVGIGCFEPDLIDHRDPPPSLWVKLWECVDGANGCPYSGLEAIP